MPSNIPIIPIGIIPIGIMGTPFSLETMTTMIKELRRTVIKIVIMKIVD